MHIVTRRHISEAAARYPDAAKELGAWQRIVENARWMNFVDVRRTFKDADSVDGYVVFNVRGSRYRMITVIHYAKRGACETNGHVYVRSFLTHAAYNSKDKWDPFADSK